MILVAGLAVAGLVGIAAAFYFSIRSGNGGDKRLRPAGAARTGSDRRPGSRSGATSRPERTGNTRRTGNGRGSPNAGRAANATSRNYRAGAGRIGDRPEPLADPWPDEPWPDESWPEDARSGDAQATDPRLGSAVTDPRLGLAASDPRLGSAATDPNLRAAKSGESLPGSRTAARLSREAHAGERTAKTAKPRRRVGFRKGADLDEELWPAEAFGGISDEQFWDDLASDKPLTTTARTAQQDQGARPQPAGALPTADRPSARATSEDRSRAEGRRGAGSGAYPEQRTGPNPATERTVIQPAYAATQPVHSMQPGRATPPRQSVAAQLPGATQPVQVKADQLASAATSTRPAETRGRRRPSSAEEDPLTSSAFALRASGPVDGRSQLRPRDTSRGGSGGTPYGENYEYGTGGPAAQADDPRRQNGNRARHASTGAGIRAYPQDSYQGNGYHPTGGHPAEGYPGGGHPGSGYPGGGYQAGGHQGNGYRGNGHRAPYDPRDDYRRLTQQR